MLNRQQRRALERAEKKTHKLEPQVCVLWVPVARGYLEHFTLGGFSVVGESERAQRFCEHYASMVAAMMREGDKLASFRSLAAVLAAVFFGGLYLLSIFLEPEQHEMSTSVPAYSLDQVAA